MTTDSRGTQPPTEEAIDELREVRDPDEDDEDDDNKGGEPASV